MKRRFLSLLLALSTFAFSVAAWAGPALDTVKSKQTELFQLLTKSDDASNKRIAQLFDEMLDYQRLAEASLGDEWSKLTSEQQKEFTELLTQLVRRSYEKNLRKTLAFDIEYLKEEKGQDASVMVVKTRAVHKTDKREEPITIDFAMVEREGKPHDVAWTLLGDRVQINSLAIQGNEIVVDMVTHGPDDPMCCPTQQVMQIYALQGEEIVQISE